MNLYSVTAPLLSKRYGSHPLQVWKLSIHDPYFGNVQCGDFIINNLAKAHTACDQHRQDLNLSPSHHKAVSINHSEACATKTCGIEISDLDIL